MAEDAGRTLLLFRHAKSAWPDVADHDRPLARRGIRAAPVMGRWLREAGLLPSQVLCSTARRARETWQFAQAGLAATPPVTFDTRIYEAAATDLLALIREVPPATGTLLLIGHNPAMEDLALLLAAPPGAAGPGGSRPGDLERMRSKFPTAAIAVLQAAGTWPGLVPGGARLTAFVTPRDLGPGQAEDS
ncbi:MAG: histidine phosphatase family protein [Actinobacteria bacterium]|nr:histidine phosphatase family protein [Actinomycetota bacterium]